MKFRAAIVLLVAVGSLVWGIVELFNLRFSAGDVYPPYSSLRADPLGCKALYETLNELPGLQAERSYRPLPRAENLDAKTALFYLGAPPTEWPRLFTEKEANTIDRFLRHSGRVIIAFAPTQAQPAPLKKPMHDDPQRERDDSIKRWTIDFQRVDAKAHPAMPPPTTLAKAAEENGAVEPTAAWHSAVNFKLNEAAQKAGWRAVYARGNQTGAVVARSYPGGGELSLLTDSYLFSNEALRDAPHPALISSLLGPSNRAVFEETHFGVSDNPGWMTLARRFRLMPALAGSATLAALFLWMCVARFAPANDQDLAPTLTGHDSSAGFLNLVRRAAPPRQLLAICLAEWERGAPPKAAAKMRKVLADSTHSRDAAAIYRQLCDAARASRR